MANVLLIWEETPENLRVFFLDNVSPEEESFLKDAAGKYINVDEDTQGTMRVNIRICKPDESWEDMPDMEALGKWADKEIINVFDRNEDSRKSLAELGKQVDFIVATGFAL